MWFPDMPTLRIGPTSCLLESVCTACTSWPECLHICAIYCGLTTNSTLAEPWELPVCILFTWSEGRIIWLGVIFFPELKFHYFIVVAGWWTKYTGYRGYLMHGNLVNNRNLVINFQPLAQMGSEKIS